MCGRFVRRASPKDIAELFDVMVPEPADLPPRYNIAPSQPVAAVRIRPHEACRELVNLRWGLIPWFADDPKIGNRLINARAETAATKPSFRNAFRTRRCLIPATGFYEWQKREGTKQKQPFHVTLKHEQLFAFAGLWDVWHDPHGEVIESCTIVTTDANELMRPIHDRMPVILPRANYAQWLDPKLQDPETLAPLLRPFPADQMTADAVSTFVNAPQNEGPQCIEKLA
jgi:putative SOS response-associated peptidase YedK